MGVFFAKTKTIKKKKNNPPQNSLLHETQVAKEDKGINIKRT